MTRKKISEVAIRLSQLKSKVNSRLPISRLSNEVLGLIFMICLQFPSVSSWKPQWFRITQVSRRWRMVALQSPAIWSKPEFRYPLLAREMLKRSMCVPLSIVGTIRGDPLYRVRPQGVSPADVLSEAFEHLERISDVNITVDTQVFTNISTKMMQPAPLLHSMTLHIQNHCYTDPSLSLPKSFLGDHAPHLRSLELCGGTHVVWDSPVLNNLTTFIACVPAYRDDPHLPRLKQITDALKRMPNLEVLELENRLWLDDHTTNSTVSVTHLPHLRDLKLHFPLPDCVALLDCLMFPSSTRIHATCVVGAHGSTPPHLYYDSLFPCLSRVFYPTNENSSGRTLKYLTLNSNPEVSESKDPCFTLAAWSTAQYYRPIFSAPYFGCSEHPQFRLDISSDYAPRTVRELDSVQRSIIAALPLAEVQEVHLQIHTTDGLFHHLASLPELHTLVLQGECAHQFMNVFVCQLSFPALDKILLQKADFSPTGAPKLAFFDSLLTGLRLRSKRGKRISVLSINSCSHVRSFVAKESDNCRKLEQVIGSLVWDEREMTDLRYRPKPARDYGSTLRNTVQYIDHSGTVAWQHPVALPYFSSTAAYRTICASELSFRELTYIFGSFTRIQILPLQMGLLSDSEVQAADTLIAADDLALQKDIFETEVYLCQLKEKLNTLIPISRLPNELLARILAFCVSTLSSYRSQCLGVTHVCRHWRSVALNSPSVWTAPKFDKPTLARHMLERARSAPLSISYNQPQYDFRSQATNLLVETLEQMTRIADIQLAVNHQTFQRMLPNFRRRAPLLQSFEMNSTNTQGDHDVRVLPDGFLGGHAPLLTSLKFSKLDVRIPWASSALNNLTSLIVYVPKRRGERGRPSLEQILIALGRMTNLEVLELEEWPTSVDSFPPSIVHLPRLRQFTLRFPLSACIILLNHLILPNSTQTRITCAAEGAQDCEPFFPCLSRIFSAEASIDGAETMIRTLLVQKDSGVQNQGCFSLSIWDSGELDSKSFEFSNSTILGWYSPPATSRFEICGNNAAINDSHFSYRVLQALSLMHLRKLHLGCDAPEQLFRYLASLPHFHTLYIQGESAHVLAAMLIQKPAPKPAPAPFPSLHTVILGNVDFHPKSAKSKVFFVNSLIKGFKNLSKRPKGKLDTLDVRYSSNCRPLLDEGADKSNKLKAVVQTLKWDGKEMSDGQYCDCCDCYDSENSDYFYY
ncbi:hypothetical protein WG66_015977 [Moniliophthora roreri]|nr:hypothetical protein WG66_015977 [Moniliophthora roreri]